MTCAVKKTEISLAETVAFKLLLISIYGSPNSDVHIFLDRLETLDRIHIQKKKLIICGDWNKTPLQEND
jgi:hypothetical protein